MDPVKNISSSLALDLLKQGVIVSDSFIQGKLILDIGNLFDQEIKIVNCIVEEISGCSVNFMSPVIFENCRFIKSSFTFSYFIGGLLIQDCVFKSYLDFQAGGHNKIENEVIISGNLFEDFVNFCDCWYEGPVHIINNSFEKGTNLLGRPASIPVTFDSGYIIKNNDGKMDYNDERIERIDHFR